jgi:hypothetical protein
MSSNVVNQVAFLRTSREFPEDLHQLCVESNKSYVDTANAVNVRTIGIFPANRPAITGNSYFLSSNRQQSLRQVFPFGAISSGASLSIPYTIMGIQQFSAIYGTCITDAPDNRPIPYASVTVDANIELEVTFSNIVITAGSGGANILSGIIIIEWLSNV